MVSRKKENLGICCVCGEFFFKKVTDYSVTTGVKLIAESTGCQTLITITKFNLFVYLLLIMKVPIKALIVIALFV